MIPAVEPIPVSRPLLFGLVAVGAVLAAATAPPTSSFAAGFAAGAGAVFVLSFMRRGWPGRRGRAGERDRAVKVLVVEDEQRIAQFLKKGLAEKGYVVEAVGNADAALELLSGRRRT